MEGTETITDVRVEVKTALDEMAHVYVHVHFRSGSEGSLIRIWSTTFLEDCHSEHRSQLVHSENITTAPTWLEIAPNADHNFLLIFQGLPKTCTMFDLIERIPQPGGFEVRAIVRNSQDVYRVSMD